jgi:transposase
MDIRGWDVQRLFAWLQNLGRTVVSHEYEDENFLGRAQLGGIVTLLRKRCVAEHFVPAEGLC